MAIVAGVDFGTLSVRVSIVDSVKGRLGSGTGEYPLHRRKDDPDHATQSHADHMAALIAATREAFKESGVSGRSVEALAIDTTGSSVIPVDADLEPLDDYYLWCDHRAWEEAALITETARRVNLDAIRWCGGVYSAEWGWAKLLHWLRHNPAKRDRMATALEHCDMAAAVLCGIHDISSVPRSVCAMGHKWMWRSELPSEDFLTAVDPVLTGVRTKLAGRYETSDRLAGRLSLEWAERLGIRAGIPVPVGAFDAHWDAIGAGCRIGDIVNVVGTSTCIMAIADEPVLIPGVCGVVQGSIHPRKTGVEAGLSATGSIFDAIARRAGSTVAELAHGLERYPAGETGLLRLPWDNGDRTVLVKPELSGVTLGWRLTHTAQDELFAAIEGTAFHTRVIVERMEEHGVPVRRIINGGGIPQRNPVLNQVYANVMSKPILVPSGDVTSLGSAIFAFLAAGTFRTVEEAQDALCPGYTTITPKPETVATYETLYPLFRDLYFNFGHGAILPELRRVAARARGGQGAGSATS